MKSILLFIFSFCLVGVAIGQQSLFTENFENYDSDQNISTQSPFVNTWSGGSADDALVTQEQANSGSQSIKIDDSSGARSDLIMPLNNLTTGTVEVELSMYVPSLSGGYFNMQKTSTPGDEWAFEVFIGEEAWHIAGGDTVVFDFPLDSWNQFSVSVDLDVSTATISLNGSLINTWDWNSSASGDGDFNQVGGINLFAGSPFELPPLSYIDDVSATFIPTGTVVSVLEADIKEMVSIYPNPASDHISVSLEDASSATVTILNSAGKSVINTVLNNTESTIDISKLGAGLYIVKVDNGKKSSTKKMIVR